MLFKSKLINTIFPPRSQKTVRKVQVIIVIVNTERLPQTRLELGLQTEVKVNK